VHTMKNFFDHMDPSFPHRVTFPDLRSGSQPVPQVKGLAPFQVLPLLQQRVVRTLSCSLPIATRRLFLLTGPHTSTALSLPTTLSDTLYP
jgi:hypothetical protein